ncbi:hypothetical protein CYLTODRAFT_425553 [Cylindrobasidium torrendii FP15055 ss-10]|uniref:Zn(2)-C6 fungal-type domain-containing protein n=1 Tax=Cylindrobasidium torrendii FP15055 ss-10 TaxID=1314674 RepID=A0A0D7B0C4_9AGAR|nr:hypothetical protein CYLTODRAFT_425553 [Cylindrobasidium torrendii FP15055 ss-10]
MSSSTPESATQPSAPSSLPTEGASGSKEQRFLACLRCRAKKAKCDNVQPVCGTCAKTNAECVRPSCRRRKRTRKEMEEAERLDPKRAKGRISYETDIGGPEYLTPPKFSAPFSTAPSLLLPPQPSSRNGTLATVKYEMPHRTQMASGTSSSSSHPPADPKMVEALSRQMAYLEGDPGESKVLKVHYYRFSGKTAIHPGFNRIVIKLRSQASTSPNSSPTGGKFNVSDTRSPVEPQLEDITSLPPDTSMVDTFFEYFGQHFPFLRPSRVKDRIQSETMSAFLLHAMNALAVRFVPNSPRKASQYISAAWVLVPPLLRLPSLEVVAGLLFLSWAEFGEGSESGLWNFAGLAIRMALDIGLHKEDADPDAVDDNVCSGKLLFWCLFLTDRILAFGTGRPVSIHEEFVEIPLPTAQDILEPGEYPPTTPSPFPSVVKLFSVAGRISNILNESRGALRTLVQPAAYNPEILELLQARLVQFLSSLPQDLVWSVDNFRAQSAIHQGGMFLFLHLWANAVIALIHHPNLGHSQGGETPISSSLHRSIKLSLASSRQIADCLVFADLFDAASYCATPFCNQCLFIAGVAFIYDAQTEDVGQGTHGDFIKGLVKQNLSALMKALKRMEHYWTGLGYIIDVLEQRADGRGWSKVDFDVTQDKVSSFISIPDMGILRRVSGGKGLSSPMNSPHDSTASTEIPGPHSLLAAESTNWSFDALLSQYQVEEVTASATNFDFSNMFPPGFSW